MIIFPLGSDNFSLYNVQAVQKNRATNLTFFQLLNGDEFSIDMYLEEIDHDQMPKLEASDEDYSKFLYEIFERKVFKN